MRFSTVTVSLLAASASALPAVNSAGVYEGELVTLEPLGVTIPQEIIDYFERHLPGTENATCGAGAVATIEKRDGCNWVQCLGTAASLATSCAKALITRKGSDEASCAASLVTYGSNIPAPCKACVQ
ncbi:putative cytochrome p450 protein [Neofusicoccum parvum UCRNP2]|uniref:Uncharacterized protein n=2 Tax=Neofusicoccum parvum TaxID=310453 RepID=A0ACB5RWW4_9PEZI|nr:putative cytochrome p450 protein [Neofusicoccum parvum UCRNP2]GME25007.1 hypothetical protein NpPPO83_00003695 [Neofusicoccum parvum]